MWPAILREIETEIEAKAKVKAEVEVEKSQNLILEIAASPAPDVIQRVRGHTCLPQAGTSDIRREMKLECKASREKGTRTR